jgi:VanZ family protein
VVPLLKLLETPLSNFRKPAMVGCIIALAILAWMPAQSMTRTALGGHAEHFIAWLGTAIVFGLGSRPTARLGLQCLLLMSYGAVLECGQFYAPGRDASFLDFAFSAAGAMLGSSLIWLARQCWLKSRSGPVR